MIYIIITTRKTEGRRKTNHNQQGEKHSNLVEHGYRHLLNAFPKRYYTLKANWYIAVYIPFYPVQYCNVLKDWVNAIGRDTPLPCWLPNHLVILIRDVVKRLDTLRDIICQCDKLHLRSSKYITSPALLLIYFNTNNNIILTLTPTPLLSSFPPSFFSPPPQLSFNLHFLADGLNTVPKKNNA